MSLPFSTLLLAICLSWGVPATSSSQANRLPMVADGPVPPLRELLDAGLQQRLERAVFGNPRWRRLADQRRLAVGLVDLGDPQRVRFARINGNEMMYAASLPKIAILLATVQAFEDGTLAETPEARRRLDVMIGRSDNGAAALMYETLGFEYISETLMDPRYGLYDPDDDGGLWVGKPYGEDGERHPDPLAGLVHAATATQVCRFYYLLAFGRLVSPERSAQMLSWMVDPELDHKFVGVLEDLAPRASIYRKSGTWQSWHSDSVLVWGPAWRRYILVGLVQADDGGAVLRQLVEVTEEALLAR